MRSKYRVALGIRSIPSAGWSYIFGKKYYTFTIVRISLYHLSIMVLTFDLSKRLVEVKEGQKFRRVYFFGWGEAKQMFRCQKVVM